MKKFFKQETFELIYDYCVKDVYKVCLYKTKNKESAELLTYKIFLDFYESSDFLTTYENHEHYEYIRKHLIRMVIKQLK